MYKLVLPTDFRDGPSIRVLSEDFHKIAAYTPGELSTFLSDFKPLPGKTYVQLNALGSSEYWGSNVNGDAFPESALLFKGASHGYKTFEKFAHVYQHHVNKDPAKSIGSVKCAAYNPAMHRVELLVEIDNVKGKDLVEKIAEGEFPEWSMGCKVPYDVCSRCGNKAAKVAFYCKHLKSEMNKIGEDGKRNCAINLHPKFFDISHVWVGADKTAKMLRKVASAKQLVPSAVLGEMFYGEDGEEEKTAGKYAEMAKEVPLEASEAEPRLEKMLGQLQAYEPAMPKRVLGKLASYPLADTLSTLSYAGVVLKPGEFQRLVLEKQGMAKVADDLDARGIQFVKLSDDDVDWETVRDEGLISPERVKVAVFSEFKDFVPHRSIWEGHIHDRIDRMNMLPASRARAVEEPKLGWVKTASPGIFELLGTLGLSYFLYRKGMPLEASEFETVIAKHPWLAPVILGGAVGGVNVADTMTGPGLERDRNLGNGVKLGLSWKSIGTVVGPVGLAYLASASARRKEYEGRELNPVEKVLRDYPALIGPLGVMGAMKMRKSLSLK
jgi:hypothetical protein